MENRKKDHIDLANQARTPSEEIDSRFYYEPMLSAHPVNNLAAVEFAGKSLKVPIWVSSMTGGARLSGKINHNLARACKEFGLGMGLGSCRILLDDNTYFPDFDLRDEIGEDLPFFANLGIAQLEQLLENNKLDKLKLLVSKLRADGLIIHVNPLQEWFQPEGDKLKHPAIHSIKKLMDKIDFPIIVKEVGQGMGIESLRALLKLPIEAIEFAAFGGTNFTKVELLRTAKPSTKLNAQASNQAFEPLSKVGHDASQMTRMVNELVNVEKVLCKSLIISGGIKSFLDGYYLINISRIPAIYGQASAFLEYAREGYDELRLFVENQVKGLELANAFLKVRQ